MRSSSILFLLLTPAFGLGAALAACSTGDAASPVRADSGTPPVPDGAPVENVPVPTCTMVDIPKGTGATFCSLPGGDTPDLQVPPGFCVREFTTTPIKEARVLRFAPNGDLFVAAPSHYTVGGAGGGPGAIIVLPDDDKDGKADAIVHFKGPSPADGRSCNDLERDETSLACVHGLAFANGYVYFTRSDEVRRVPYVSGQRTSTANAELVARLGGAAIPDARFAHTLELTPSGAIYVSRGRGDTTACSSEEMTRGAVMALHVEVDPPLPLPLTPEVIADGFRNPMYLRCSPSSCGDCYASELSGDNWDGVLGREKLALLDKKGTSWGYPCCVASDLPHPDHRMMSCANVGREVVSIVLHDTNFGLDFDRGGFPDPYKHGTFVALHGAFTSHGGSGVIFLPAHPQSLRPVAPPTMFAKGFVAAGGRATDVAFAPDGRLFIADDTSGKIYWVAPTTLAAP